MPGRVAFVLVFLTVVLGLAATSAGCAGPRDEPGSRSDASEREEREEPRRRSPGSY